MTFKQRPRNALEARVWGKRSRKWVSDCGFYRILERTEAHGVKLPREFIVCRLERGQAVEIISTHRRLGPAIKAAHYHGRHGCKPPTRQRRRHPKLEAVTR